MSPSVALAVIDRAEAERHRASDLGNRVARLHKTLGVKRGNPNLRPGDAEGARVAREGQDGASQGWDQGEAGSHHRRQEGGCHQAPRDRGGDGGARDQNAIRWHTLARGDGCTNTTATSPRPTARASRRCCEGSGARSAARRRARRPWSPMCSARCSSCAPRR
jgi:hypothetical protein